MNTRIKLYLLGIVILIGAVVRLYQLGQIPPSPDWDEAALGYNAYSVLKTGRDEYGTWFPLSLRSFDDYKPPLYMYLTIPSIGIFGLETWAVRLPSALAGIIAVAGVYFLTQELFKNHAQKDKLALVSALLLAISPWHIQFSRIAFEANIGLTLNIWAAYSFLKGLRNRKWLTLCAFLFGLSLYAYHSERIFAPLLVGLLALVYRKDLFLKKQQLFFALVVGIITVLPLIGVFVNQNTLMRLRGTSSLADQTGLLAQSVKKLEQDKLRGDLVGELVDNRRLVWMKTIADGYLSHFSFRWLFITGDNSRHHAPDMGLLYIWELPFLLYGLYWMIFYGGKGAKVLIAWFLIAPIAASPTTELPHAIRTLVFLPTFQIFTAAGLVSFLSWFGRQVSNKQRNKTIVLISLISFYALFLIGNVTYYLHMYFGHTNKEFSSSWQFGYREAVDYAQKYKNGYQKIVVSTKLEQPHMFFLFFTKYDPWAYLAAGGTKSGGFAEIHNAFDIYEFRTIDWEHENHDGTVLYIGTPREIPTTGLFTINYLDGVPAIRIATR